MNRGQTPLWIVLTGALTKIFHVAFRSDSIGSAFFGGLLIFCAGNSVRLEGRPAFGIAVLGVFVCCSSLLQIVLRMRALELESRRRRSTPKYLFLHRLLGYHKTWSLIGEPLCLVPFAWATAPLLVGDLAFGLLQVGTLAALYMPLNRFFIVNVACLQLAKVLLTRRFRIVVFRRFLDTLPIESVQRFDQQHKTIVLPALGAYGTLVLIHNESIENAPPGPNADSEQILSQLSEALRCNATGWQGDVIEALKRADLAVFHWPTPPTDNMLWELQQAQRTLPASRLLFIQSESSWDLAGFLNKRFILSDKPHLITINSQNIAYGRPFHEFMRGLASMANGLHASAGN